MTDANESRDAALGAIELIDLADQENGTGTGYEPLGQAIARVVREAIHDGRLRPGTPDPSGGARQATGCEPDPGPGGPAPARERRAGDARPAQWRARGRLDIAEHVEIYRIREALEPIAIAESATRLTASSSTSCTGSPL